MKVYETGIRNEEFVYGPTDAVQTAGSVMQVKGFYPPSKFGVSNIELTDYRDKLSKYDFFSNMTMEERKKYLKKKSVDNKDLYLEDVKGLEVRFTKLGGIAIKRLNDKQKGLLQSGKYLSIKEVSSMFNKPGSTTKGRKNMVFRPGNWCLFPTPDTKKKFKGVMISIDSKNNLIVEEVKDKIDTKTVALVVEDNEVKSSEESYESSTESSKEDVKFKKKSISVSFYVEKSKPYTEKDIAKLLDEYPGSREIVNLLTWASPSIHKSLIQKMIRTRCLKCDFLGRVDDNISFSSGSGSEENRKFFSGKSVLVVSFVMLLQLPGTLNSELKRFETGLLSATKRAAVSIAEDSHVTNDNDLLLLFAAGYYAKTFTKWKPSITLIRKCIDIIIEAYENIGIYKYNFDKVNISINKNPLDLCYHLIQSTKALKQDIPMIGNIAKNKGVLNKDYTSDLHIDVPIVHCIDQHNITDIAWHFPYKIVKSLGYPKLFQKVWTLSSSANGRKSVKQTLVSKNKDSQLFISQLREAQYSIWILRCFTKLRRELILDVKRNITYTLDDEWIAALLGIIVVKVKTEVGNRNVSVVCDANEITNFKAIIVPKREESAESIYKLTEEEIDDAIKSAKIYLKRGIDVKSPQFLKEIYPELTIKYRNKEWKVNGETWKNFRNIIVNLDVCIDIRKNNSNACIYTGNYIENDMETKVRDELSKLDAMSRVRLLTYITGVSSKIEMNKISRDGKSVKGYVVVEDVAVYTFLCSLCVIVPAAIEAKGSNFIVKNGPLMRYIVEHIIDLIYNGSTPPTLTESSSGGETLETRSESSTESSEEERIEWIITPKKSTNKIVLYQHQIDAVQRMKTNYKHIIYITAGLGKTLIVIEHIKWLKSINQIPKYIIYTLPTSAYKGVTLEFINHGFEINLLDMTAGKDANYKILPYVINFIKHDYMRMKSFYTDAAALSNNLLFIADEFHYAMADTQRTHYAISLATISKRMIALTGTLIKSQDVEHLIDWLKLVSKFEVTSNNYMVAVGALIASRVDTDIAVKRKDIHIDLTPKQKKEHDKGFSQAVEVCYTVIVKGIVSTALEYIDKNIGVFIVTKDIAMQEEVANELRKKNVKRIHLITSKTPIDYKPKDKRKLQAIITTIRQATGYTITGMYVMITSVYFSNQSTRTQLDARLNRLGQLSRYVNIITLHTGLLSYVLQKYDKVRTLAEVMKSFATVADIPLDKLQNVKD